MIERSNGLATTFAYDAQGRPTNILTGSPDAGEEIADPFHYDGVGHLESNEVDRISAIAEANQDLAAQTGLSPRTFEKWWTENTVDELAKRLRNFEGRQEAAYSDPNVLHQVEEMAGRAYTWDVNGNPKIQGALQADGSIVTDSSYTHDWRDRLVQVDQGDTTTRLVVVPLGRLVAKLTRTTTGDATRVYLHDGDQVVAEYVQEAGGTNYQLDRRKTWKQWIDDLVAEEADSDLPQGKYPLLRNHPSSSARTLRCCKPSVGSLLKQRDGGSGSWTIGATEAGCQRSCSAGNGKATAPSCIFDETVNSFNGRVNLLKRRALHRT